MSHNPMIRGRDSERMAKGGSCPLKARQYQSGLVQGGEIKPCRAAMAMAISIGNRLAIAQRCWLSLTSPGQARRVLTERTGLPLSARANRGARSPALPDCGGGFRPSRRLKLSVQAKRPQ